MLMSLKKTLALAGVLLGLVSGCKQNIFLAEADYEHYKNLMPANLENDPCAVVSPITKSMSKPPTVLEPERKPRYISLAECVSTALEQGTVGFQNPLFPGIGQDTLVNFTGQGVIGSDSVRVFALDPAIVGNNIESALSKFDAVWTTSLNWLNTDRPIGTAVDNFLISSGGLNSIESIDANFNSTILKPLPTGGVAGVTFKTDYQYTNLPAFVNPFYKPTLQFQFEQPLLQGYGVEINQLRPAHPGSITTPGVLNSSSLGEGILVTRVRFDQQRAEFERQLNYQVLNVEYAYWNLYGAYWTLFAREQALRQGYEAWRISKARLDAGTITLADLAQTRGQYELFRGQRLAALDDILEKERQLRALMGMPAEDSTRMVPSDAPTLSRFEPDWDTALDEALNLRPELYIARQQVKVRQMEMVLAKNQLMPDLRFTSTYDSNAIGSQLDGPDATNAFRNMAGNRFNNWSLGLRMNVPIGYRAAHAVVRNTRLELARSYEVLQDQELKTGRFLSQSYRKVFTNYEQVRVQRAQREAFAEQLRIRFQEFLAGKGAGNRTRDTVDILLEAQRFWADSLANEYQAIVQYNISLAGFEFAKGTILKHNNVHVSEGALPGVAQVRATEHFRERTKALVIRERENPLVHGVTCLEENKITLPEIPKDGAVSLPALFKDAPAMPQEALKEIPAAKKEQPSLTIPVLGTKKD
ncbi:MAG: TolC family protein [Gemmataceae bacterium]|nr:TolC family protein [Gemmataceae bacterium]